MKKIFIIGCLLACAMATYAQTNYTTYQFAFRQGKKIITAQPHLNTVVTTTTAYSESQNNYMRQQWTLKRQGDGRILIASSADSDKFLRRNGNTVVLADYDASRRTDYLWTIEATVSNSNTVVNTGEGNKLLALIANASNTQSVLTLQANGSFSMSNVNYGIANDPYRIYVVKKAIPGRF